MGHCVYKYVLDDEIIYIGKNDTELKSRVYSHETEKSDRLYRFFEKYGDKLKIYYTEVKNRLQADLLESFLIDKYKPSFNIAKNYEGVCSLFKGVKEPKFREFRPKAESRSLRHLKPRRSAGFSNSKYENMAFIMDKASEHDFTESITIKDKELPHSWKLIEKPVVYVNMPDGGVKEICLFDDVKHEDNSITITFKPCITTEIVHMVKNFYEKKLLLETS